MSCRVSRPCGTPVRAGGLLAGAFAFSAIVATLTTRSTIACTSLRSHLPSDSFASRSFSRMVWWAIDSAKCRPQ